MQKLFPLPFLSLKIVSLNLSTTWIEISNNILKQPNIIIVIPASVKINAVPFKGTFWEYYIINQIYFCCTCTVVLQNLAKIVF